MLNLSNILDELTEEQMDRVLEFKGGWKGSGSHKSHSHKSHSHKHSHSHKSKSKSKSCSWKFGQ
ncbi:hypothetical protein JY651_05800 [Pyxidicoccus parkwayensis]|uniref:Uncharacterized protein n=1 Tax=Pyxidicoccus parkwayensis TaxID=2813578 RepID=A0ABX7NZW1_9BACT|nr:hypothetical protein [Pyxidicoccus parkwaysis]QSQ24465.1 hypothetical protein JY651_05800 [Pyxidicoccus parkwaysis]